MPSLEIIRAGLAELPKGPPLVVALAGGTTGVGSYIAKALATTYAAHGSKLRVYIVGRNIARAESVIADARQICPASEWRFVRSTDLTLISEIDRCSADIIRQETEAPFHDGPARLDLFYMTYAYSPLKASLSTSEGLDSFISSLYYSRIRFILQLMPLLTASPNQAHVISVYAGSFEEVSPTQEPPIGTPSPSEYGVGTVRRNTVFMKNFAFEKLAEKHAGKVSFIHIYPGLVDGPGFYDPGNPLWARIIWRIMYPLLWLVYMTSPTVCGQVMLYLATPRYPAQGAAKQDGMEVERGTNGELGGGSYAVGQRGDAPNKGKSFAEIRKEGLSEKIWDHTMEVLEQIEKKTAHG